MRYMTENNRHKTVHQTDLTYAHCESICQSGATPLYAAVVYGHPQIVATLVDRGANVNLADKKVCSRKRCTLIDIFEELTQRMRIVNLSVSLGLHHYTVQLIMVMLKW